MATPATCTIWGSRAGASASVRYPWAIGPPNGPAFARSGSTWIHWWSPVASANRLTWSWVISVQSVYPMCSPTRALRSSMPEKLAMRGTLVGAAVGQDGRHERSDGWPQRLHRVVGRGRGHRPGLDVER